MEFFGGTVCRLLWAPRVSLISAEPVVVRPVFEGGV